MKKAMLVLIFGIPVICTLGLSFAVVGKAFAVDNDCDPCGCCNFLTWDSSPATATADFDTGQFSFNEVVRWGFDEARSQGTIVDGSSTPDFSVKNWSPSLFFPDANCCTGILNITASGTLTVDHNSGTFKSKATIVYPDTHLVKNVTITRNGT